MMTKEVIKNKPGDEEEDGDEDAGEEEEPPTSLSDPTTNNQYCVLFLSFPFTFGLKRRGGKERRRKKGFTFAPNS